MARKAKAAFTMMEIVISLLILGLVVSGLITGYVQANWTSEWCSMSLAAQSYASEGAEQARAADWRPHDYPPATGYGTMDELPAPTNYTLVDFMDVPTKGTQILSTNYVSITNVSTNPPIRQIRSDAVWIFAKDGSIYTNTVILIRTSDQ